MELLGLQISQLKDLAQTFQSVVAGVALVFGAIAAYYKFLRGRVFRARIEISMSSSILLVSGQHFFKISAKIKNTGSSCVRFNTTRSVLRILIAEPKSRTFVDNTKWKQLSTVDFGDDHRWIEAAETVELNWLFDLPENLTGPALRAQLCLASDKPILWIADTIAECKPSLLSCAKKSEG